MQISKTNNVIFFRDVESNIIDQAFVVLKNNIKMDFDNSDNKKMIKKIDILKDTENFINYEINRRNIKYEKLECERLNWKLKILKISNVFSIVGLIISILIK